MTRDLQIIGLIYDAAGIAILGIPAVFRMVDEIAAQSGTYWNGNPHLAKALSTARIDTTIGSILLLFGLHNSGSVPVWLCRAGLLSRQLFSSPLACSSSCIGVI